MADKKITELDELTTLAGEDVLPIVDNPSGTPVTKKVSIGTLDNRFVNVSGDSITGNLTIGGHLGVGSDSPDIVNNVFQSKESVNNTSGTISSIFGYLTVNPSAASTANYVGVQAYVYGLWDNAYNMNLLAGYYAYAGYYGTATCSYVMGLLCGTQAGNSGTVTNAMGINITSASKSGTASITNNYGLYIEAQSAGASNYAIYTNSGIIRFGDTLKIASGKYIEGEGTGENGFILKNLKNTANTAVSGTAKTIVIDIGGTPYYFLVYPTSAA